MCNKKNTMMNPFWGVLVIVLVNLMSSKCIKGGEDNGLERYKFPPGALAVNLTLMQGADAKGAVCLDGSLPGYHFHPGYGPGANNWIVTLEGGGWCNDINTCRGHKGTSRGSSKYMEDPIPFLGILSNSPQENPDFFNWNRVKIRYCDGASFSGDNQDMANQLYFRGQRIWSAAIEDFMLEGMRNAEQVLLSGCSAGGLAAILHCDEFRGLFPSTTKVKCLSDAGMFLDVKDAFGGSTIRDFFGGVVSVQGLQNKLSQICTNHLDPTSCFFPQNLIADIKTPMFLLNSAYDSWQVQFSLGRKSSDWVECTKNIANCTPTQVQVIQAFRKQMLDAVNGFSMSKQNGLLINSCSVHCQSEDQVTWLADNKKIAQAVGDWYFDRAEVKEIDCPYPCDKFCHYNNSLPFNTFL